MGGGGRRGISVVTEIGGGDVTGNPIAAALVGVEKFQTYPNPHSISFMFSTTPVLLLAAHKSNLRPSLNMFEAARSHRDWSNVMLCDMADRFCCG